MMEMRLRLLSRKSGVCSSSMAPYIVGADVRLDRVRRTASAASSTARSLGAAALLARADVSVFNTLDLMVVYGGAYELARRRTFSFSIAAFIFSISNNSRSSVVNIFCFMRVFVNFGLRAFVVVVAAGISVRSS